MQEPASYFFETISRADSPMYEQYSLRPYNPDELFQKRGNYDIFDEMREDEQISAVLTLKKFLILNSEGVIECEDENVKEFLERNIHNYLPEMFEKKLFNILSALDYGFSLTEKVFAVAQTKEFGQKIILKDLRTRPPHSFDIHQDDHGDVTKIVQDTANGQDIDIDPKKFIHYAYQKEYDNPYGKSELNQGIYRAWWSKNAIIKFWNIFLERFGMPTAVGKYPRADVQHKDMLKKALSNLQSKTAIVIPDGFEVDFLTVTSGQGETGYEKAIDKYNTMIARKMLIPDLLGYSGSETKGGSYALGSEQFRMFYNNIRHERNQIERLINREIIQPLVYWNFGSKAYAEFKFEEIDDTQEAENLKIWLQAIKDGKIPVTDQHINWFLQKVNAPEIEQKELDRIREEKEAFKESLNQPKKEEPEEEKEEPEEKKETPKSEFAKSPYYRDFTKYEKKIDFQKIERETKSIEDEYKSKLGDTFELVINGLIDDIKRKNIIEKKRFDLVNKIDLRNTSKIQKLIYDMSKDAYNLGSDSVDKPANFAIAGSTSGIPDDDVLDWLKEFSFYITGVESDEITKKVKGILITSIQNGTGIRQTVKMIDESLKGYDINLGANRIEAIVRTTTNRGFNEARAKEFDRVKDDIIAYQYSAIMDGRTSPLCESLDEKIFRPSEIEYYNPPNHFNCRSLIVPIFKGEDFENYDDIPATEQENGGFLRLK